MVYTIDQLKELIIPVAERYGLRAVWVFGSYARNEATEHSDIDLLIDRTDSKVHSLFHMGGVYNDLVEVVDKQISLITTASLTQDSTRVMSPDLIENVYSDRKILYEKQ